MSTLNVSNITDGTTTVGTSYVVNGSAKAWVNISSASLTNPAGLTGVNGSFNVASVLDVQTGEVTVSFTNNMNNDDYSVVGTSNQSNTVGGRNSNFGAYAIGTSSYTFSTTRASSAAVEDGFVVSSTVHGDLA